MIDNPLLNLNQLEKTIGHSFNNIELLIDALTHRSYANEAQPQKVPDNERLEFLGDAVLGMLISHYLLDKYPQYSEGKLSKLKSYLVSKSTLAGLARNLGLGEHLRLGKGEISCAGQKKSSLLANVLEAVIGAIYLDGGVEKTREFVLKHFADLPYEIIGQDEVENYKGALQEFTRMEWGKAPAYKLVGISGPEHRRIFEIQLTLDGKYCVNAYGHSKKQAEQAAAKKLLQQLIPT